MKNSLNLDKRCLEVARKQFCLDIGLPWEEYEKNREKSVLIQKAVYAPGTMDMAGEGARNYAERNSFFRAIICLGQLFICCDERIYDWVVEQYGDCKPEWFCNYRRLRKLDEKLREYGHEIYDTHIYFLPEAGSESETAHDITKLTWYSREEILRFKNSNRFSQAMTFWEGQPDMLAVAAMRDDWQAASISNPNQESVDERTGKDFDQSHMCAMAGASRDGEYLWQIGINVDKDLSGQGLGHRLVRALKEEILRRGKVPFYGTSESHTLSQTVGLKAGFAPAWTEVYVREIPK
ncbi:MAG: GNAT family N-acetyltransferase [Lachnospiraceae bacterium]|nr:GNAT family N-acetyltransferase [Lachnospiraceae bacterium]